MESQSAADRPLDMKSCALLPGVWRACGNFIQPHIRTVLIAGVRRGREGSGSTEERVCKHSREVERLES